MPAWCSASIRALKSSGQPSRGGRREVRGDLVAPRAAEGVLGERQELDVGEAELGEVGGQLVGQLAVGQAGPPGAEVQLVDRLGLAQRRPDRAGRQPLVVAPLVVRRCTPPRRCRAGSRCAGPSGRPSAARPRPARGSRTCTGRRRRPRARTAPRPRAAERAHRVRAAVPVVEVADDPHARAFGAQTANDVPLAWPASRTCAPSTRHSCSCRPSPIRCRSISPSVGRKRYGSSALPRRRRRPGRSRAAVR